MEITNQNLLSAHNIFQTKGVYDLSKICLGEISMRNMAEREVISENEFNEIFGGSDEENDFEGFSDVGFSDLESEGEEENGETNHGNDEDWTQNVGVQHDPAWVEEFLGRQQTNFIPPESAKPLDFFSLLFDDRNLDHILAETNLYARQKYATKPRLLAAWNNVTSAERKAFFCICIIMGIDHLPSTSLYWSTNSFLGNPGIQRVISRNRFQQISQMLHFNDSSREPKQGAENFDRLYKIRPMLSQLNRKFQEIYSPSQNISVDEGMIAFKGRLSFRQYMPAKPTKYGIKVWMAADSANRYVLNYEVYLGKEPGRQRQHGLGYDVVMTMTEPFWNLNHHVFFDNFFSSPKLLQDLLDRKTYACSTVRLNRKGLPACSKKKLKTGEIVCSRKNHIVFTKWHDKRDVSVLSTNCNPQSPHILVQRTNKKKEKFVIYKPRVIQLYSEHMGGVDLADQLRSYYAFTRSSTHWYKYIFWYLFDVSVCNSFLLSNMCVTRGAKPKSQLDFRSELAAQLIGNFCGRKRSITLPAPQGRENADEFMGHFIENIVGRKKQCVECKQAGRKTPKGYPIETRSRCRQCQLPMCRGCFVENHARRIPDFQVPASP